jgi:hypothetical protein
MLLWVILLMLSFIRVYLCLLNVLILHIFIMFWIIFKRFRRSILLGKVLVLIFLIIRCFWEFILISFKGFLNSILVVMGSLGNFNVWIFKSICFEWFLFDEKKNKMKGEGLFIF